MAFHILFYVCENDGGGERKGRKTTTHWLMYLLRVPSRRPHSSSPIQPVIDGDGKEGGGEEGEVKVVAVKSKVVS